MQMIKLTLGLKAMARSNDCNHQNDVQQNLTAQTFDAAFFETVLDEIDQHQQWGAKQDRSKQLSGKFCLRKYQAEA